MMSFEHKYFCPLTNVINVFVPGRFHTAPDVTRAPCGLGIEDSGSLPLYH